MASYLNVPVVALWGPTDANKYAPWSSKAMIVRRNDQCNRCQDPKSKLVHHCMSFIKAEDVIQAVKIILGES